MVADVATGRDAVAENSLLMNQTEQPQPQLGSKKGKKKKKTAAPVDSVSPSLDYLFQWVSWLESQVSNLQRQLAEVKEENKQQVAENKKQFAENEKKFAENKKQFAENEKQFAELKEESKQMRNAMLRFYRRMILDQARMRLLDMTGINCKDFESSELLATVKSQLPNSFVLNDMAHDFHD